MKIGFIGLGIMGSRMAANLQKHGYPLVLFNRTRSKAESLLANGAEWAASPAAMAGQVAVLFTMLAHPESVKEAALGQDGFLTHLPPDALWVDCSTVNPSFSKQMAAEADARGVHFIGAPVSGSKTQAADGVGVTRCFVRQSAVAHSRRPAGDSRNRRHGGQRNGEMNPQSPRGTTI